MSIDKKRTVELTRIFVSFLLILTSSFFYVISEDSKKLLCAIIIWIFSILYVSVIKIDSYFKSLLPTILNCIFSIKYLVIPFLVLIDDNYMNFSFRYMRNEVFFINGALLSIWEEIFVGIFIYFVYKKWYKEKNSIVYINIYKNNTFINLVIFVSLVLITMNIEVFTQNYNFTWDLLFGKYKIEDFTTVLSEENVKNIGIISTIISLLIQIVYIISPILACAFFYKMYAKRGSKIYYYLSLVTCLLPYMIVTKNSSRSLLIIPIVAGIYMMLVLFPKYKRSTWIISGGAAIGIFTLLTLWKSFGGANVLGSQISITRVTVLLDQYFQGIINMGKAYAAYEMSNIVWAPHYLINDVIHGIPVLSNYADISSMSRYLFDVLNIVNDQVIPITGQGLYYFTWILAPVGVCFVITVCRVMEKRIYTSQSMPELYIFCYATVMLSYGCFSSITIFFQKLLISTLPSMLVIIINKRVRNNKENSSL